MKQPKNISGHAKQSFACLGCLTLFVLMIHLPSFAAVQPARQQFFTTPEKALEALRGAVVARDNEALERILGPDSKELLHSGDPVEEARGQEVFSSRLKEYSKLQKQADDVMILYVGKLNWPMPIPLVRQNNQWYFNTAEGKEEIINRRIGENEIQAIEVCRAYVEAQGEYAKMNLRGHQSPEYAQHFLSDAGQKNGLYWRPVQGEPQSPFGPLVAEAQSEGYMKKGSGDSRAGAHAKTPYHGYYYHILTRQGEHAPGGARDYVIGGRMSGGFALVAYPAQPEKTGVMSFIVNQDGKIYQKNLGEKTTEIASQMKAYDRDSSWAEVN